MQSCAGFLTPRGTTRVYSVKAVLLTSHYRDQNDTSTQFYLLHHVINTAMKACLLLKCSSSLHLHSEWDLYFLPLVQDSSIKARSKSLLQRKNLCGCYPLPYSPVTNEGFSTQCSRSWRVANTLRMLLMLSLLSISSECLAMQLLWSCITSLLLLHNSRFK